MSGLRRRPAVSVAQGVLVVALGTFVAARGDASPPADAEHAVEQRRLRIADELDALGDHAWAGAYFHGDGLGVNLRLTLAPASGHAFTWQGCLGLYDCNMGEVAQAGDRLQLSFVYENRQEGFRGLATEFLIVRWGERRYLVAADDVVGFCNEINAGSEPRAHVYGRHFLRQGDETVPVTGFPELPSEYDGYLLEEPLGASIVSVGPSTARPSKADFHFVDTSLVLDTGEQGGLRAGMRLFVMEPDGLVESVTVTAVEADRAVAVITQSDREDEPVPQAGWRLSTRPRWSPAYRR